MSFADKLRETVENAPVATGGTFIQYGKLRVEMNVLTWRGKGKEPEKVPYTDDMEIEEGKQDLEFNFFVNVKELNPSLQFDEWSRKIIMRKSSKQQTTDWAETVLPSLEKVFGDKWADVCVGKISPYVECEQAPSQFVKAGERDWGVPRFLRVFKNKAACEAARNERYGAPEDADNFDFGDDEDELGIPADVVEQAMGIFKVMKKNINKTREFFEGNEPFKDYDSDALFAEIGIG